MVRYGRRVKIFFYFDLEFTYYGHAMATWFKRDLGMADADLRGIVVGRLYHDFLHRQTDIAYQDLGLYQDLLWRALTEPPDIDYLRRIESELEIPSIWLLFDADRSIKDFTYEQALSAMTIFLRYYEEEFTKHRPDAVISFTNASLSAAACYLMARRLEIPYLEMTSTRIPRRYVIGEHQTGARFDAVERRYRELVQGAGDPRLIADARSYLARFRDRPSPPDGMQQVLRIASKAASVHPRRLVGLARITAWYYFGPYRKDVTVRHPLGQAVDVLSMAVRRRRISAERYFRDPPPTGERYAYFALHYQPEMTTMVLAPFWQDQLTLVENIARSLPPGLRLYVKEHLPMLGSRPLGYYDRLRKIPNVRLVSPSLSSLELARGAEIVLTITGTVGWEALLLERPVVTFGRVFYNAVECVQKCRAIEDLPAMIRSCLARSPHDERQVEAYVAALLAESFEFDGEVLWDPSRPYESVRDSSGAQTMYRGYRRALERLYPTVIARPS